MIDPTIALCTALTYRRFRSIRIVSLPLYLSSHCTAVILSLQLLFKDGQPRWERLQSLLEEAGTTNDYDVTLAVDQLLAYLVSDKGRSVRDILAVQMVEILDTLGRCTYPPRHSRYFYRYSPLKRA